MRETNGSAHLDRDTGNRNKRDLIEHEKVEVILRLCSFATEFGDFEAVE